MAVKEASPCVLLPGDSFIRSAGPSFLAYSGAPRGAGAQLPTSEHCPGTGGSLPVFDLLQIPGWITLPACVCVVVTLTKKEGRKWQRVDGMSLRKL